MHFQFFLKKKKYAPKSETICTKDLTGISDVVSTTKRKVTTCSFEKKEDIKKPKWSDVDIDSLFACHSSIGKYGFGFDSQKHSEEGSDCYSLSRPACKTNREQKNNKVISFVRSQDILDLKTLNKELITNQSNDSSENETIEENSESEQILNHTEENIISCETKLETNEPSVENEKSNLSENINSISDTVILKGEHGDVIINRKKRTAPLNVDKPKITPDLTSFIEMDIDEIDKALCEALYAKKAMETATLKKSKELTESTTSPTSAISGEAGEKHSKDIVAVKNTDLEKTNDYFIKREDSENSASLNEEAPSVEMKRSCGRLNSADTSSHGVKIKSMETVTVEKTKELTETITSPAKAEKIKPKDLAAVKNANLAEDILKKTAILIDKLNFLVSASSSVSSMTGFVQLQTRFVDWQAGALDSKYFLARLAEVEQYFQDYEMSVVSGDWACQWDRINKRYFYVNSLTQHSQWTYPAEQCSQGKSWIKKPSKDKACTSSVLPTVAEQNSNFTVLLSKTTPQDHKKLILPENKKFKDASIDPLVRLLQSSPPPPPPGVESPPPPPPHTPPPKSPPLPDSSSLIREPEDMDLENSGDSSSFLLIQDQCTVDTGNLSYQSTIENTPKKSMNVTCSSGFKPISSAASGCEEVPGLVDFVPPHKNSELNVSQWSKPSSGSQMGSESTLEAVAITSINNNLPPSEDKSKPGNVILKKEKKKSKLNPSLGLKKKNIPSLVEKWQKIKEEQDKEDRDSDDSKKESSL